VRVLTPPGEGGAEGEEKIRQRSSLQSFLLTFFWKKGVPFFDHGEGEETSFTTKGGNQKRAQRRGDGFAKGGKAFIVELEARG